MNNFKKYVLSEQILSLAVRITSIYILDDVCPITDDVSPITDVLIVIVWSLRLRLPKTAPNTTARMIIITTQTIVIPQVFLLYQGLHRKYMNCVNYQIK